MPAPAQATPQRLLDAAAEIASTDGLSEVSVRAVIRRAHANLNAVHYHFGSRQALLAELAARALAPLNRERAAALDRLPGRRVEIESVIDALYRPLLARSLLPGRQEVRRALDAVQQMRHDPSLAAIPDAHSSEIYARARILLERALGAWPPAADAALRFVNAAAWDTATRPHERRRVEQSPHPARYLAWLQRTFVRAAAAALRAASAESPGSATPMRQPRGESPVQTGGVL